MPFGKIDPGHAPTHSDHPTYVDIQKHTPLWNWSDWWSEWVRPTQIIRLALNLKHSFSWKLIRPMLRLVQITWPSLDLINMPRLNWSVWWSGSLRLFDPTTKTPEIALWINSPTDSQTHSDNTTQCNFFWQSLKLCNVCNHRNNDLILGFFLLELS